MRFSAQSIVVLAICALAVPTLSAPVPTNTKVASSIARLGARDASSHETRSWASLIEDGADVLDDFTKTASTVSNTVQKANQAVGVVGQVENGVEQFFHAGPYNPANSPTPTPSPAPQRL